jgi:hypothetical protein
MLPSSGGQLVARRSRNRLCQVEERMILALAKILRLKKFGQTDHLCASARSIGDAFHGLGEILFGLRPARHLHQRHSKFLRRQSDESSEGIIE